MRKFCEILLFYKLMEMSIGILYGWLMFFLEVKLNESFSIRFGIFFYELLVKKIIEFFRII